MGLLSGLLKRFVQKGTLHVTYANGQQETYGGTRPGPGGCPAPSRCQGRAGELFFNPELAAAEAYMDGA
jgi:cyclopropane-fatty-acyl-phospholipid synthase